MLTLGILEALTRLGDSYLLSRPLGPGLLDPQCFSVRSLRYSSAGDFGGLLTDA
jgi:hypothetical protein